MYSLIFLVSRHYGTFLLLQKPHHVEPQRKVSFTLLSALACECLISCCSRNYNQSDLLLGHWVTTFRVSNLLDGLKICKPGMVCVDYSVTVYKSGQLYIAQSVGMERTGQCIGQLVSEHRMEQFKHGTLFSRLLVTVHTAQWHSHESTLYRTGSNETHQRISTPSSCYISLLSDAWTDSSLSATSSSVHMLQWLKLAQREIYECFLPFPMGWILGNMQVGYNFYNAMYAWKYSWDVSAWRYRVLDSRVSVLTEIHDFLPSRLHKIETDVCKMCK